MTSILIQIYVTINKHRKCLRETKEGQPIRVLVVFSASLYAFYYRYGEVWVIYTNLLDPLLHLCVCL